MQTALTYRTNRDLFSNHYLDEHLPETEAWDELTDDELRDAKDDIMELWEREKDTAPKRNESQLEEKFIRPMFRKLGIPFEVEESTSRTQRRPDYGFFESEDAARGAFERREEAGDFYKNAVAVADAKRWGRPLDTRGSGEHERDFENPSYQIHVYLQETPSRWAVLTDGQKWRLYYGPTSHRLDSYYEIDLPTVLEQGDLEDFKYFYLFLRHGAFLEDSSGQCFLDEVYDESNVFAQELGEDLQDNIYEAIKILSEGFMQHPDNDLSEGDLDLIHDSSLIYLYRLIFVLYSEAEGRELLDTNNEIYKESYSLNSLKQDIAEELDSPSPKYRDWQDNLWDRLDELFKLIDQGSKSRGIPEEDLYIPAYNGGLFRTDPDEDDSVEARFIASHQVGDAYLAEVIELLTRSQNGNGGGKIFVDYSSLDVRHIGSIYEGILEYQLDVADEPLALEDGEYVSAGEGDEVIVEEGEVHLSTGSGERKATGSYYTPEYVVEYIVEETLGPLVDDIRSSLVGQSAFDEGGFAEEFAEKVFDLKILDPAMGSGHFLTGAIDYLAREIIDAQEKQAAQQGIETVNENHDINWARRKVAQRCIYGVDKNPLAVELSKVSLWLRTLAAEQPLAFLDHHLKTGNSLVGSDIEDVLSQNDETTESGQLTLQQSFAHTRRQALEHVMERFTNLLSIDNETLEDIKEMEEVYEEVRDDPLYQHLLAMANVHTAEEFGLDIPGDAYERMAEALRDNSWEEIEEQDWFRTAQVMADDEDFFHWQLEYPVAFYNDNGERKTNPGFDVVIGNPPYFNLETTKGTKFNDYLRNEYDDIFSGKADVLYFFIDQGEDLFHNNGSLSFIVSRYFTEAYNAKDLREKISRNASVNQIVDFGNNQVFPGVDTLTIILNLDKKADYDETEIIQINDDLNSDASKIARSLETVKTGDQSEVATKYTLPQSTFGRERWLLLPESVRTIKQKVNNAGTNLGEFARTGQGMMTGLNEAFTITEEEIAEWGIEDEVLKPLVKNGDLRPYLYRGNEHDLIYLENKEIDDYPATKRYLEQYRDDLMDRAKAGKVRWYRYQNPINKDLFEDLDEKVICPFIATDNRFYLDKEELYNDGGDIEIIHLEEQKISNESLVALCNSDLLEFYHLHHAKLKRDGFYEYFGNSLQALPINTTPQPISDDQSRRADNLTGTTPETTHDALTKLSSHISNLKDRYNSLNLDLLSYIGTNVEGPDLPDLGFYQPTAEPDSILHETDSDNENHLRLRIDDIRVTRESENTVHIEATARYRPDADEDFVETEYKPAFRLTDISEAEADLVEAFVPVGVNNNDVDVGFYNNATKTISLMDRIEGISVPTLAEVEKGLQRYIETKERADELDDEIEETNELINEIVYDLYGLTDEEIEIVESAVQDD